MINKESLASRLEVTLLKADATPQDIYQMAHQADQLGCASVCVNGVYVAQVANQLQGSQTHLGAVADYPLGSSKATIKAIAATTLAKDGATQINIVAHLPHLLRADLQAAKADLIQVTKAVRSYRSDTLIKVIIHAHALLAGVSQDQGQHRLAIACQAVREIGGDFIKTAPEAHQSAAKSIPIIQSLKTHAMGLYLQASSPIKTYHQAAQLIQAGADQLASPYAFEILRDCSPANTGKIS